MKALQLIAYGDIETNLKIHEINKPTIKENQVLIQVKAVGINPADYKVVSGIAKQVIRLNLPAIIGYDVSGIVTDVGKQVKELKIGDAVFSSMPFGEPGTIAEYIAVDDEIVYRKPTNIGFCDAASLPVIGLSVIQCFNKVKLKKGDRILIHAGSGGVGTFALQYAKLIGAYIYTTTSTKNIPLVTDLGADRVIDYTKEDYLSVVKEVDVVLDTLGGHYTEEAFRVIRKGGSVISLAGPFDDETAIQLGLNRLIRVVLSLKAFRVNRIARLNKAHYNFLLMDPRRSHLDEVSQLIQEGVIHPVVGQVYPFSESVDAFVHLKTGHAKGKIVISFEE